MYSSHPSLLSSVTKREDATDTRHQLSYELLCEQPVSSLIVLGIVFIWLLVLVPMWLNRHDADNASRSMDSFSTAMRVLSRRPPARPDRRYVVMPRRDSWGATVDNNPDATTHGRFGGRFGARAGLRLPRLTGRRSAVPKGSRPISGRARVLARRRRIALAFAVLTIGLAVSAIVVGTSWWLEVAADLLLAGYLVHLRNEAIRVSDNRRRRMARAARLAGGSPSIDHAVRSRQSAVGRSFIGTGSEVGGDALVGVTAASASGTANGSRWEPVPVPLPTYVSKPVVQRPAASAPTADVESGTTIDLTRPGAWIESHGDPQVDVRHLLLDETGSGTVSASSGAPRSRPVVEVEDDELDVILARRRAVGD